MEFKDEVKININHLDKNVIDQVTMYEAWSRKWADAVNKRDRAKENLSVVKAEADELIRKNPSRYGWNVEGKSPTEAWIATKVTRDEKVINANTEYLDAVYETNIMAVAKETLEHRKKALEILTDLYKGNYFVARSRDDSSYRGKISDEVGNAQREALQGDERLARRRKLSV